MHYGETPVTLHPPFWSLKSLPGSQDLMALKDLTSKAVSWYKPSFNFMFLMGRKA